nr:hypothetical protein [Candidatus Njordarchaeota archaeon]
MTIETERVKQLETQVRSAYVRGLDIGTLADLALQLVIDRGILEDRIARGDITIEEKKRTEDGLKRLKELEKYIIRAYYTLAERRQPTKYRGLGGVPWKRTY